MFATLLAQASQLPFDAPVIDFHALAPEIVLVTFTAMVLLVDVIKLEEPKGGDIARVNLRDQKNSDSLVSVLAADAIGRLPPALRPPISPHHTSRCGY